tara:strand:- start:82 stop:789 length:708 start_codon:yes stop_codon:yes gene_type:complete
MKFIPTSLIGWIFLIVGVSGFVANYSPYSENYIDLSLQIIFVYVIFFIFANIFNSKKDNITNEKNSIKNSSQEKNKVTSEIDNLKVKIGQLNEEDELKKLKEELNQKRLERGLISLTEYEQLEQDINNTTDIYKAYKTDIFDIIDKRKSAKTEKIFGTLVFTPLSLFLLNIGLSSDLWFLTVSGILSVLILIYNFSSKSTYIKWSESEIERLTIEKDSSLKELKKLKKIYKNQTI